MNGEHLQDYEEPLYYLALGDFARHLLVLHQQRQTEVFPAVARAIERFHLEGDGYVREAATIGLPEGIQNAWNHGNVDPELFVPYWHPESVRWRRSRHDFWSGQARFVAEGQCKADVHGSYSGTAGRNAASIHPVE